MNNLMVVATYHGWKESTGSDSDDATQAIRVAVVEVRRITARILTIPETEEQFTCFDQSIGPMPYCGSVYIAAV